MEGTPTEVMYMIASSGSSIGLVESSCGRAKAQGRGVCKDESGGRGWRVGIEGEGESSGRAAGACPKVGARLRGWHVEPPQVVFDVAANAAQRGLVEGAALADERDLLEQRLGLAHLLEQRKVDRLLRRCNHRELWVSRLLTCTSATLSRIAAATPRDEPSDRRGFDRPSPRGAPRACVLSHGPGPSSPALRPPARGPPAAGRARRRHSPRGSRRGGR
eukprot:7385641-Prymnesium_polylepis.1